MKRLVGVSTLFGVLMAMVVIWGGAAAATSSKPQKSAQLSGAREFGDENLGSNITECPQAGINDQSLRRTDRDDVERLSDRGDDIRLNQDYACMPQDEMSIAVNPTDTDNVFGGANDYRLGWGSSGFYVTTDSFRRHGGGNDHRPGGNGNQGSGSHHDGITIFPTPGSYPTPAAPKDHIDGGGDPIAIFDREGTAYYGQIHFERENDTGGIFVNRSTNGGFTWSRPCIPNAAGACGGNGDPRQPGDGVVTWNPDNDGILNGSVPFDDKPYGTSGPRPAGVAAQCFTPAHTPTPCPAGHVGPDRIYITWTRFFDASEILISYSDDRARSWSMARVINGSAAFCVGGLRGCSNNQGSQPVVNPTNGHLYVTWENFNTPDENQYLLVRSSDGSTTFAGPFFITPVFDVNYPQGNRNRQDCVARGQGSTRAVLTNSCARVNARGAIAVDKRGGAFADDLYLVIADNRNGTIASTNTDVLLFKSTNGGTVWTGPTRVNDDPSSSPASRNCGLGGRPPCPAGVHTGNDQWFPWLDISGRGWLHGAWQDRRLDTTSPVGVGEWPTSKTRVGNYIAWYWGGRCRITQTGPVDQSSGRQCVHPAAAIITQPTAPVNPPDDYLDPAQSVFPFRNFGISDVPYNWDYCFRAGIFCGDYENLFIDVDNNVWSMWTDARNGRSSRTQTGRNPACEQSDAWADSYKDNKDAKGQQTAKSSDSKFWVTPCPTDEDD